MIHSPLISGTIPISGCEITSQPPVSKGINLQIRGFIVDRHPHSRLIIPIIPLLPNLSDIPILHMNHPPFRNGYWVGMEMVKVDHIRS